MCQKKKKEKENKQTNKKPEANHTASLFGHREIGRFWQVA